jgi:hypothetical protein
MERNLTDNNFMAIFSPQANTFAHQQGAEEDTFSNNNGAAQVSEEELKRRGFQSQAQKAEAERIRAEAERDIYRQQLLDLQSSKEKPQKPTEPTPVNPNDFDFSDPEQVKKFNEQNQQYLQSFLQYNRDIQNQTMQPLVQQQEQERYMQQVYGVAQDAFQELAVGGLDSNLSQELAQQFADRFYVQGQMITPTEYAELMLFKQMKATGALNQLFQQPQQSQQPQPYQQQRQPYLPSIPRGVGVPAKKLTSKDIKAGIRAGNF